MLEEQVVGLVDAARLGVLDRDQAVIDAADLDRSLQLLKAQDERAAMMLGIDSDRIALISLAVGSGLSAFVAPSFTSPSILAASRSCTITGKPAASRCRASELPISPTPTTAMRLPIPTV